MLGINACVAGEAAAQDSAPTTPLSGTSEEELLELVDDEEASARVAETLSWLRENPLDLNNARRDELLSIPGLMMEDAEAIVRFRETEGPFESLDEVGRLPGGEELAARISPYVFIQQSKPNHFPARSPVLLFSTRLSGFVPGTVTAPSFAPLGNMAKSITRAALRLSKHVQIGILYEKDAGERVRDGFASGYISYRGNGILDQVVLGDFCAEAGRGLVMSRGTSFGRAGSIADGIRGHAARLVPYHLADESHYLRGGAVALKSKIGALPMRWLLILSRTSLAANLNDQGVATGFYTGGLYRTEEELDRRNSVHEVLAGTRLECDLQGRGSIGLTYYRSSFDRPFRQSSPNEFSGARSEVAGADFTLALGRISLFGESARTVNGGTAWMGGFAIRQDSSFRATISYRDYSENFDNPHAGGDGVQTNTTNERGFSIRWSVRLAQGFLLQGSADQCKIPTRTYTSFLPRTAADLLFQATALPVSWVRFSVAFRTRKVEGMLSGPGRFSNSMRVQESTERSHVRFNIRMEILPHLDMKIRIEHAESRPSSVSQVTKGNMASHTICYNTRGIGWECGAAFFDAESYEARLYDFEGNLRGSIASPPLSGRGSRWHLVASWDSVPWVRFAAKYAVTLMEKIPTARELAVQTELRF